MIKTFGTAGLLSRLYLAAFFASHVTHALAPGALKTWAGTGVRPHVQAIRGWISPWPPF